MLQCCSHPVDSRLPAALPCQPLCWSFSCLRSIFPPRWATSGTASIALPTHGRQPAGAASLPLGTGLGDGAAWAPVLRSLPKWRALPAVGIIVPIPPPAPVPADSSLAGSVPCVPWAGGGTRSPRACSNARAVPHLTAMVSTPHNPPPHIPCLMSSGSPLLERQPDAKTRSTSPGTFSGCRTGQRQYLTQGKAEDGIQCALCAG